MPPRPDLSLRLLRVSAIACAGVALVAGCTPMPVQPPAAPPPPPMPVCPPAPPTPVCEAPPPTEPNPADVAARRFFFYQDQIRGLQGGDLMRELGRIGEPNGRPQAIVEFALVLGQTRNPADTVRALSLLDPLVKSTAPEASVWQPMARLLQTRFIEQRRVEEQADRQGQQLREAQRQMGQLNEKLEALKAIERSLNTPRSGASSPAAPVPKAP